MAAPARNDVSQVIATGKEKGSPFRATLS